MTTQPQRRLRPSLSINLVVTLLAIVTTTVIASSATQAAVIRPFGTRFSVNTTGAIVMTGNTSMTCPSSASGCLAARSASVNGTSAVNNNSFSMVFVDVDATGSTFNSSRNTLTIPPTSNVAWAGLYWGADTSAGPGGSAAPDAAARGRVQLQTPASGGYVTVTAGETDSSAVTGGVRYQAFADVTGLVVAGRSGEYTVANLQAGRGQDRYGGWALVVAYQDPAEPLRNLTIFDGYAIVQQTPTSDQNVAVPVSGFLTPPSGPVRTRLGVVAYEGDLGLIGDSLRLNDTPMTNSLNPATNFFNSSIGALGSSVTTGDPLQSNLLGIDIDTVDASGVLANGSTSATINLRTNNDTYFPGVVSFSTELFAPQVGIDKSAIDVDGGSLDTGDEVLYTIRIVNGGQDAATGVVVTDEIPEFTTFVPGSLTIDGAPVSDVSGDDLGELVGGPERVVARIGSGATPAAGGSLAIGAGATVSFRVRVGEVPNGAAVTNVARASFRAATSGLPIGAVSNTSVLAPRLRSDLSVLKTGPATPVTIPGTVDYTITVENRGPADEPAAVVVDDLPAGLSVTGTTSTQGTCSSSVGTVTCDLGALAVGATAAVVVSASVASGGGAITNSVTVSGANLDLLPNNNTARAATELNNPPVAVDRTATTPSGTAVTVDALSGATDPDGDVITLVAAGPSTDGSVVVNADGTVTFTPAPGFAGTAAIPFTVSDGRGGSSTATVTVTVLNAPPIAVDDAVSTAPATAIVIGVLDNDSDPNSDALSVTGVTQPAGGATEGVATLAVDGTVTFVPNASFRGSSTFSYTITDGIDTASANVTVVVPDAAPVAIDDATTTPSATAAVIDVLANDLDDNGDPLTVIAVGQPAGGASVGTASIDVDGSVRFDPAPGFRGTAVFDYTISDGIETATATVTVEVLNAPPAATADAATTASGTPVTVDVLGNDSDPNADPLAVVDIVPPAGGSATVAVDGTVTYTPRRGFKGDDVIVYTISDGITTATSTLTVTVLNAPPVAAQDQRTTGSGRAVTVDVLLNDLDVNGDALTVSPVVSGGPSHGTAVVGPDGTITYSPDPKFAGIDSFRYTISDGTDTATARVIVTVLNGPPVAADDAATTPSGVAVTVVVLGNDSDPNDDTLTVAQVLVGGPSNGTAVVGSDGRITYTPDPGFVGIGTFEYVLGDGVDTARATVTITVTPGATPTTTAPTTTAPSPGAATSTTVPVGGVTSTTLASVTDTTTQTTNSTVPVTGPLPSTGASPVTALVSGALALAAGVVLVLASRRRGRLDRA